MPLCGSKSDAERLATHERTMQHGPPSRIDQIKPEEPSQVIGLDGWPPVTGTL
jgi:hypothetical protein